MKIVISKKGLLAVILFSLAVFQNPLETIWSGFSYIDEIIPLFGLLYLFQGNYRPKLKLLFAFILFIVVGLLGNIIYEYQPIKYVLLDLYSNVRFFFSILAAMYFFQNTKAYSIDKELIWIAKIISILFFIFTILDYTFNLFPNEVRYGIRSIKLFYGHSTYLAGAIALLIIIFTIFPDNNNKKYTVLDVILLLLTMRSKAVAFAGIYILMYVFAIHKRKKIRFWHIIFAVIIGVIVGYSQISYYFGKLSGSSARSVMLLTSLAIMKDYFPIGTGFGTYGSHVASAGVSYSPVYVKYGFNRIYELRNSINGTFFDDQFWPIIFGQTGIIGTIAYVYILYYIIKRIIQIKKHSINMYYGSLLSMIYLLISSFAEPAFNNSVAFGFALIIGMCFAINNEMINYEK